MLSPQVTCNVPHRVSKLTAGSMYQNDLTNFRVDFVPPVKAARLAFGTLLDTHVPPLNAPLVDTLALMFDTYRIYEYMQLCEQADGLISHVYFAIETTHTNELQCSVDLKPYMRRLGFNVKSLCWFPPDINMSLLGFEISCSQIPQRTPAWHKLRADNLTGTKAAKLLGFNVPLHDDTWTLDKKEVFSAASRRNMRFGAQAEDRALLSYLHLYPEAPFEEVGFCKIEGKQNWGASPDGKLGNSAALEIKSSLSGKTTFEPYFYPQVYMEMMALNVKWCHVVRFAHEQVTIYMVHRDENLEAAMTDLWNRALQEPAHKLIFLLRSDVEYVSMRMRLTRLAAELCPANSGAFPRQLAEMHAFRINLPIEAQQNFDAST